MLLGVTWRQIGGAEEARGEAPRRETYALEQLEPRLLLNADFLEIEPAFGQNVAFGEQAVLIDLDLEQADLQYGQPQIVIGFATDTVQSDETGVDSRAGGADTPSTEVQSAEEVVPSAPADGPLDADVNADSALSAPSLGQAAFAVETECPGCDSILQAQARTMPAVGDPQEIIQTWEASSVNIRGPPWTRLNLPGLSLVDPAAGSLDAQVIYLDFDGAQGVAYRGPVTEKHIDVPAFSVRDEFAGQDETIIAQTLDRLRATFAGSGIQFTTAEPGGGTAYTTIYVGGDDSPFARYGSFLGLAEKVDVGNQDRADSAFVFSCLIGRTAQTAGEYAALLADVVAHEAGHLLGFAHGTSVGSGPPARRGRGDYSRQTTAFCPRFCRDSGGRRVRSGFPGMAAQSWLGPGQVGARTAAEELR